MGAYKEWVEPLRIMYPLQDSQAIAVDFSIKIYIFIYNTFDFFLLWSENTWVCSDKHNIIELLGCFLWDHILDEKKNVYELVNPCSWESSHCVLWTLQQTFVNDQWFLIVASFLGKRLSYSCLIMLRNIEVMFFFSFHDDIQDTFVNM